MSRIGATFYENHLVGLFFFDEEGRVFDKICHCEYTMGHAQARWEERLIPDGEEIIGIYGVKDKEAKISMLGFLTRYFPPPPEPDPPEEPPAEEPPAEGNDGGGGE